MYREAMGSKLGGYENFAALCIHTADRNGREARGQDSGFNEYTLDDFMN
jgi:hypothetical protein